MIRLALALVLAVAPLLAGPDRHPRLRPARRERRPLPGLQRRRVHVPDRGRADDGCRCRVLPSDGRPEGSLAVDRPAARLHRLGGRLRRDGLLRRARGRRGRRQVDPGRAAARRGSRPRGTTSLLTHEPGDTEVGAKLRQIVLDPATGAISHRTEALLYAADKAEHVDRVVAPALARGAVVVTDRYVDSHAGLPGRRARPGRPRGGADRPLGDRRPAAAPDRAARPAAAAGADPVRGARPDRGRVGGVPRAGAARCSCSSRRARPEHYLVVDARLPVDEIAEQIRHRLRPLLDHAPTLLRACPTRRRAGRRCRRSRNPSIARARTSCPSRPRDSFPQPPPPPAHDPTTSRQVQPRPHAEGANPHGRPDAKGEPRAKGAVEPRGRGERRTGSAGPSGRAVSERPERPEPRSGR